MKPKGSSELAKMLEKENFMQKPQSTRHARFGGTFALKTSGGAEVHVRKLPNDVQNAFDQGKKSLPINKKSKVADKISYRPIVKNESRKAYADISEQFLENCLNSTKKSHFSFVTLC